MTSSFVFTTRNTKTGKVIGAMDYWTRSQNELVLTLHRTFPLSSRKKLSISFSMEFQHEAFSISITRRFKMFTDICTQMTRVI